MNFHTPEATALAAMRERLEEAQEENRLLRESLVIAPSRLVLFKKLFKLTAMEGRIVDALLDAKGAVMSRHRIAVKLYGLCGAPRNGEGESRVIDVLLTKIRHKLRQFNPELEIETCWGLGWCISANHRSIILAHVGEITAMPHPPN